MQVAIPLAKEITKQTYQVTAQDFARNVADLAPLHSIEKLMEYLPSSPSILDIGCGSGRDAKFFTEAGAEVLGIDFCPELLAIATKDAPLAKFQLMDIEEMALPAASFDGAWAACSLGHIAKSHLPNVLGRIHTLLKPGGYFYLALKQGTGEGLEEDTRYENHPKKFWAFYEEQELRTLLQNAHFQIQEFDLVEKTHAYQTQPAFRVFCQKHKDFT